MNKKRGIFVAMIVIMLVGVSALVLGGNVILGMFSEEPICLLPEGCAPRGKGRAVETPVETPEEIPEETPETPPEAQPQDDDPLSPEPSTEMPEELLPILQPPVEEPETTGISLQGSAEIDKPVSWTKTILAEGQTVDEIIAELPSDAQNILIQDTNSLNILSEESETQPEQRIRITYETPAPTKDELPVLQSETGWNKFVIISSDASIHYTNVEVETEIPEANQSAIKIYHLVEQQRNDVTFNNLYNVQFIDENQNGLIEKIQWTVPQLSEQQFEITSDEEIIVPLAVTCNCNTCESCSTALKNATCTIINITGALTYDANNDCIQNMEGINRVPINNKIIVCSLGTTFTGPANSGIAFDIWNTTNLTIHNCGNGSGYGFGFRFTYATDVTLFCNPTLGATVPFYVGVGYYNRIIQGGTISNIDYIDLGFNGTNGSSGHYAFSGSHYDATSIYIGAVYLISITAHGFSIAEGYNPTPGILTSANSTLGFIWANPNPSISWGEYRQSYGALTAPKTRIYRWVSPNWVKVSDSALSGGYVYSGNLTSANAYVSGGRIYVPIQDNIAPTTTATPSVSWNTWTNSSVTVSFACNDAVSNFSGVGCGTTLYCNISGTSCTPSTIGTASVLSSEGIWNVSYRSNDSVGNLENIKTSGKVMIDKTAPTTLDNYGAKNGVWQNTDQSITLTTNCTISGCEWTRWCNDTSNTCNPTAGVAYTGAISYTTDGTRYFRYASKDNAGNTQTTVSRTVMIDKTAPTLTLVSPANRTWTNQTTYSFTFNSADTYNSPMNCSLFVDGSYKLSNTSTQNNINTILSITLTQGTRTWYVSCKDSLGNTNSSETRTIYVDTTKPVINLMAPLTNTWINKTSYNFTLNVSDNLSPNASCSLYYNNTPKNSGTIITATPTNFTATALPQGTSTWYVNCTDLAGNLNQSAVWTLNVDSISPTTTATAKKADGNNYTFGEVAKTAYVNITLDCNDAHGIGCNKTLYCVNSTSGCTPNTQYSSTFSVSTDGVTYLNYFSNDSLSNTETITEQIIILETCIDIDGDGFGNASFPLEGCRYPNIPDCDDFNATIRPLVNNTQNNINESIVVCPGYYNNTHVVIDANDIYLDCNDSVVLDGYDKDGWGVYATSHFLVNISNCNISNYSMGIYFDTFANYNTIKNNKISTCSSYGAYISDAHDNNITDNTILDASYAGIGLVSNAYNNTIKDNNISYCARAFYVGDTYDNNFINNKATSNTIWNFESSGTATNNNVINLTTNDTTSSFKYGGYIALKGADGTGRLDETGYSNISHYLNIINNSVDAWIYLNVSFTDADISHIPDSSSIRIWKNSGGEWFNETFVGPIGQQGIIFENGGGYVYANITNFSSIYAPMGEIDITPPVIILHTPVNPSITKDQNIEFNFTATDDFSETMNCTLYVNGTSSGTNTSVVNNTPTIISNNSLTEGIRSWYINCTDDALNTGQSDVYTLTIDRISPQWSNNLTNPASPVTYAPGQDYQFNITWTDATTQVEDVVFEFDGTNYTYINAEVEKSGDEYYITLSNLAVGEYQYKWYANDSAGNWNETTGYLIYNITQAEPSLSLNVNPSWTETYGTQTTVEGTNCPAQLTCTLYINDTPTTNPHTETLGGGIYNYTFNTTGNDNYTSASTSQILTINQATRTCTLATDKGWTRTFDGIDSSTTCEVSAGSSDGSMTFTRNLNAVSSPDLIAAAGIYEYVCQWTGGVNYSDCTQQNNTLLIEQADAYNESDPESGLIHFAINGNQTESSFEFVHGTEVNATGWKDAEITDGNFTIKINGSTIATNDSVVEYISTPSVGIWNYTLLFGNSQNYSDVSITKIVEIIKNCTDIDEDGFGNASFGMADCTYPNIPDCDDFNRTIRPLLNNTQNNINESIVVCYDEYLFNTTSAIVLTGDNLFIDCNNSKIISTDPGKFRNGIFSNTIRNNIVLSNCDISNFGVGGIRLSTTHNLTIFNNTLHDVLTDGAIWGIVVGGGTNHNISRNTIYNIYDASNIYGFGIETGGSNKTIALNNISSVEIGIRVYGENTTLQNNIIYDNNAVNNYAVIVLDSNNTKLIDNTIFNNYRGISISSNATDVIIYNSNISNNTLYGISAPQGLNWIINETGTAQNNPIDLGAGNITVQGTGLGLDQQNTKDTNAPAVFGNTSFVAQTFTPSITSKLNVIELYVNQTACTPHQYKLVLTNESGAPTTTVLTTLTSITGYKQIPHIVKLIPDTPTVLDAGIKYAVVASATSCGGINAVGLLSSSTDTYTFGARYLSIDSGTTYQIRAGDLWFKVYVDPFVKITNSSLNNTNTVIEQNGTMIYKDSKGTNIISGNLIISGNYLLDNSTLKMNCSTDGGCGINVTTTGRMDVGNDSLITAYNPLAAKYRYRVFGAIEMDNSTVEYVSSPYGFEIRSDSNLITNSTFRYIPSFGIRLYTANNNLFIGNKMYNNSFGAQLDSSDYNGFYFNEIYDNELTGLSIALSSHNWFENNIITQHKRDFSTISTLIVSGQNNTFTNNNIFDNGIGLSISGNSEDNAISNNFIYDNLDGIKIEGTSSENLIYNNFFNNSVNAQTVSGNFWNTTYNCDGPNIIGGDCIHGNFWNDYIGYDRDEPADGVGDTHLPYNISGGLGTDEGPLTNKINSLPEVLYVNVTPDNPFTTNDLNCSWVLTDNQETQLNATVTWFNDNIPVTDFDTIRNCSNNTPCHTNVSVQSLYTTKGENWTCQITPYDGYEYGNATNGSEIIKNSVPVNTTNQIYYNEINHTFRVLSYAKDEDGATDITGCTLYYRNETEAWNSKTGVYQNTSELHGYCNATISLENEGYLPHTIIYTVTEFTDSDSAKVNTSQGNNAMPNILPTISGITPNVTNVKNGTPIFVESVNAWDEDTMDDYYLMCGNETNVFNFCNSTLGRGERNCTFNSSWEDDGWYTMFCRLNDTYNLSSNYAAFMFTSDNTGPRISIRSPSPDQVVGGTVTISARIRDELSSVGYVWFEILNRTDMSLVHSGHLIKWPFIEDWHGFWATTSADDWNYTLIVYANDTLGNENSAALNFTVDNTLTSITFINPGAQQYFNEPFDLNITFQNTVRNISIAEYEIYNSTQSFQSNTTTGIGAQYFEYNDFVNISSLNAGSELENGNYSLVANATDAVSNFIEDSTWFVVDTTVPEIKFESPTPHNEFTNSSELTLNVSAYDVYGDIVEINWNGTPFMFYYDIENPETQFMEIPLSGVADGNYTFKANMTDLAGNYNETEERWVYVDTTAPVVTIYSPENGWSYESSELELNYTVIDPEPSSGIDSCWYSLDSGENISLSDCNNITLPYIDTMGEHTITIYANDTVGNTGSDTNIFYINCITPHNDLYVNHDTLLCPGTYYINDTENDGLIIINNSNIFLDCNWAYLIGDGEGYAVYNDGNDDVNISNCLVRNYEIGLYLDNGAERNDVLYFESYDSNWVGVYIDENSNNNVFEYVYTENSNAWDIYSEANTVDNQFIEFVTSDSLNYTIMDFEYAGEIKLKYSDGSPTANPEGHSNISHYLNISGTGWLDIAIFYEDYDWQSTQIINESRLGLWKYDGTWQAPETGFADPNDVDIDNNYVYANITDFGTSDSGSTFAIMGAIDEDGDGFDYLEDCDDSNPIIRPLRNNTENHIDEDIIICYGTYDNPRLVGDANTISIDCNNSKLIGTENYDAIYIPGKYEYNITNCEINGYRYGIHLYAPVDTVLIENNTFKNVTRGIYMQGRSTYSTSPYSTEEYAPMAGGTPIPSTYYVEYISINNNSFDNASLSAVYSQISRYVDIYENKFTNNVIGLSIMRSNDYNVVNNTFENNGNVDDGSYYDNGGLILGYNTNYATIFNNTFNNNYMFGISNEGMYNNIHQNTIENNTCITDHVGDGYFNYGIYNTGSDTEIFNNTIRNVSAGITILSNAHIEENKIEEARTGIFLDGTFGAQIINNTITDTSYSGIHSTSANTVEILGNTIENSNILMYLENIIYSLIANNTLNTANNDGIYTYGNSEYNDILENNITGAFNAITIYTNSNYNTVFNNNASFNINNGVFVYQSTGNNITENVLDNNLNGVYLSGANYTMIENNNISSAEHGLFISGSDNNTFINNKINSDIKGIRLESSSDNTLENIFVNSTEGISVVSASTGNIFDSINITNASTMGIEILGNSGENEFTNIRLNNQSFNLTGQGVNIKNIANIPQISASEYLARISRALNITKADTDGWIYLNLSYESRDLQGIDITSESTLRFFKHNGTWTEVPDSKVDTTGRYVYGNITDFSIIAIVGNLPTPVSSGGGIGGGGVPTGVHLVACRNDLEVYRIERMLKNEIFTAFEERFCTDLHFAGIETQQEIKDAEIRIKLIYPEVIPPEGTVYDYYNVTTTRIEKDDIKELRYRYRVPIEWADSLGLNIDKVVLYREKGVFWEKLESEYIGEDDIYYYYGATAKEFSYYSIVGQTVTIWDVLERIDLYYRDATTFTNVLEMLSRYYTSLGVVPGLPEPEINNTTNNFLE